VAVLTASFRSLPPESDIFVDAAQQMALVSGFQQPGQFRWSNRRQQQSVHLAKASEVDFKNLLKSGEL
jgi:hypothetical protein